MPTIGIPDKEDYGNHLQLTPGELFRFIVNKHFAEKAKLHTDIRIGSPETGLLSWASRKGLPEVGQKRLAIQQPLHSYDNADFEGRIEEGYGRGNVVKERDGQVLVTRSTPQAIHFTTASSGTSERFVMLKSNFGKKRDGWLLINVTPHKPLDVEKKHYIPVSAERAEAIMKQLPQGANVQPKIDGSAIILPVLKDKIEALSYRQSKKTQGPIVHTEKIFGGIPNPAIPKDLRGSLLRGEVYGQDQEGKAIHPAALGGLLNSSLAKSLTDQKQRGIDLKTVLFDVDRFGKKDIGWETPYQDRYKMLEKILPYLPKDKVSLSEKAETPEAAMKLWQQIKNKQHSLTSEGVVIHPSVGKPMKAKLINDYDVHIRDVFPGEGKYLNNAAGGFSYSHSPEGEIVGKVGTGFSDEVRKDLWQNKQDYIGRIAKVNSQELLPSKALRAPSFSSFHEDYPLAQVKQSAAKPMNKKLKALQALSLIALGAGGGLVAGNQYQPEVARPIESKPIDIPGKVMDEPYFV